MGNVSQHPIPFNREIGGWIVSNVKDMSWMFYDSDFNQNIGEWSVSNVTDMEWMFRNTPFNHNISLWNVSNVTNMQQMFQNSDFNQNISSWDVSNVTNMRSMFSVTPFNRDISAWDVSNVTNMRSMFSVTPFNQDISAWNVSNVSDMSYMFRNSGFNQDISSWDVSWVTTMAFMFSDTPFNQNIGSWDVRKVTDMSSMFRNSDFDQNISEWDVSSVTNMRNMFTSTPFNQDIGSWIVSNVTDMSEMFENASSFDQDISGWVVSNVTHMSWMFRNTEFNRNIGSWDVSNVINMEGMLSNTPFDQNISGWDISKVWNFKYFLSGSKLSTDNYNNLLIEWSKLELVTGRAFHAGFSKYDLGEPADRRQYIIDHFGWTISDGGCWCVTDVDNNTYPTVMINGMEWMAENLRVTKYSDDTSIPSGLSDTEWSTHNSNEEGAVAVYDHEEVDGVNSEAGMAIAYGRLYNWYAVVDARGLCPAGWRVPTNDDWSGMVDYLMTEYDLTNDETDPNAVGNALKSCRQVNSPLVGECATEEHPRWNENATHYGTDDFGFSALPAGNRHAGGPYGNILSDGYWWTTTEDTEETFDEVFIRTLYNDSGQLNYGPGHKGNGLSVRCVKD